MNFGRLVAPFGSLSPSEVILILRSLRQRKKYTSPASALDIQSSLFLSNQPNHDSLTMGGSYLN